MKERPLLFKAEMVRAILEERKTQTRRIVKPQPKHRAILSKGVWYDADCINPGIPIKCPYGQPGDRLWVKETWRTYGSLDDTKPSNIVSGATIEYAARGNSLGIDGPVCGMSKRWRSPLFMLRWMSRITLEITTIRVERLNDISMAGVLAEGCILSTSKTEPLDYQNLWESINGPGSWKQNPWVWVVLFKRIKTQ